MDNRKWQAASAATPPAVEAAPSTGYPTDGDPGAAAPATEPGARWFHQLGEELRNVITGAGLTPSDSDLTQLQAAIQAMIDGRAGQFIVRAASTANIDLAAPGANVDGVAMVAGELFLPKDQTTGSQNGIYIWNGAAVPATRPTDADSVTELKSGSIISVREGTLNADTLWTLSTDGTIVIGTTALTFAQKSNWLASSAEAQALTNASKSITPATLAGAFGGGNQSLGTSGYQKLPGDLILQWGNVITDSSGNGTWTYPITFPTGVYRVFAAVYSMVSSVQAVSTGNETASSCAVKTSGAQGVSCLAIGR